MLQLGYEDTFSVDFNNDNVIGFNLVDDNADGFVDGSFNYKLFHEGNAIDLTKKNGRKLSDNSSRVWDAIKAIKINSGFEVFLKGQEE